MKKICVKLGGWGKPEIFFIQGNKDTGVHGGCGKCSKISSTLLFLLSSKMLDIRVGIDKMFARIANREDLQKQGLPCLSRPF